MTPFEQVRVINVETVSGCNLRCRWCSLSITRKKLRFMAPAVLDRVLDGFARDVLVCAYLGGEPLLHPDFPSVVRQIRSRGFEKVRIHTNGSRVTPELAEALFGAGLTAVVVSVDGRDAAEHEALRGQPFEEARRAVQVLLDASRGRCQVGVQSVVAAGAPKVVNSDLGDLRDRLDFQIVEHPHSWVWPELEGLGTVAPDDAPQTPCFFLQYYMAFDWQGSVLPCCRCLNSERTLANVRNCTPREAWEGPVEELRQEHLRGAASAPCATCDWYAPNVRKSLRVVA